MASRISSTDEPSARVLVTIPATMRKQLEQLARKEAVPLALIGRRALRKYLTEQGCKPRTK
jgi:hypothetical protein